jgi:hypothetical protein
VFLRVNLWLSFPITRDDGDHGDSLRLAQSSPRRKHETVHRSSACGVRIRRHNRWPPYRRFLLGRRLADGHFPLAGNRYIGPKRKSDFALHSADNASSRNVLHRLVSCVFGKTGFNLAEHMVRGPGALPGASPGTPLKSTPEIFRSVEPCRTPRLLQLQIRLQ